MLSVLFLPSRGPNSIANFDGGHGRICPLDPPLFQANHLISTLPIFTRFPPFHIFSLPFLSISFPPTTPSLPFLLPTIISPSLLHFPLFFLHLPLHSPASFPLNHPFLFSPPPPLSYFPFSLLFFPSRPYSSLSSSLPCPQDPLPHLFCPLPPLILLFPPTFPPIPPLYLLLPAISTSVTFLHLRLFRQNKPIVRSKFRRSSN